MVTTLSKIPKKEYDGTCRKLLLALDIGTTFSGVSYSILDPGTIPQARGVNSFPGQSEVGGDCKIPSVVLYNGDGTVRAVGSEVKLAKADLDEEEQDTVVEVRRFKLHLAPESMRSAWIDDASVPPLPLGKTAVDVVSDFLVYLYQCARKYIRASEPNGPAIMETIEDNIDFILSHPNGWRGQQQADMRRAAIKAGLIPETETGDSRLQFVTEGEASLHYCLDFVKDFGNIKVDSSVLIIDAGGGTIDCSAYKFTDLSPVSITEIAQPGCRLEGSESVTARAITFLKEKFKGSPYVADVAVIGNRFDETVKRTFKDSNKAQHVDFGRRSDHQPDLGITRGNLKLTGAEVESFFKPSLVAAIDEVKKQRDSAHPTHIQIAFMVGGFAANDWLFYQLREAMEQEGIKLFRPHLYTNKAVAHGSVSSYFDHFVTARITRETFGTIVATPFDPTNVTHILRKNQLYISPSGEALLPGAFQVIIKKGTVVTEDAEFSEYCVCTRHDPSTLDKLAAPITCYRGGKRDIEWVDDDIDNFNILGVVTADTSNLRYLLTPQIGMFGLPFYQVVFRIIFLCGKREMKAYICWKENGVEKRSPATIVYTAE
ncbi:hypothetical protein JAAARDRAFT_198284 [Jaapia argillacea MUCL 33604]|uniref:Actin-like ATPase domain-containing protein n=1 Tax=Jaapia argillacea MUCL 33604 TaxID=933084 RepID=A0A067PPW9_9AGAM|nr:hypothetical protein JAAARDRAFT_198284 [Jaapia argillacea MUCL 33604]